MVGIEEDLCCTEVNGVSAYRRIANEYQANGVKPRDAHT
jgi:hypothetical protein